MLVGLGTTGGSNLTGESSTQELVTCSDGVTTERQKSAAPVTGQCAINGGFGQYGTID